MSDIKEQIEEILEGALSAEGNSHVTVTGVQNQFKAIIADQLLTLFNQYAKEHYIPKEQVETIVFEEDGYVLSYRGNKIYSRAQLDQYAKEAEIKLLECLPGFNDGCGCCSEVTIGEYDYKKGKYVVTEEQLKKLKEKE